MLNCLVRLHVLLVGRTTLQYTALIDETSPQSWRIAST